MNHQFIRAPVLISIASILKSVSAELKALYLSNAEIHNRLNLIDSAKSVGMRTSSAIEPLLKLLVKPPLRSRTVTFNQIPPLVIPLLILTKPIQLSLHCSWIEQ